MNVLLIGSGGREHAIAKKVKESKRLDKLYCLPGNPGIAQSAEIVNIPADNFPEIIEFSKKYFIDLIICGPEKPLVDGLADQAEEAGIAVFGPKKSGSILEGSKIFSKQFMYRNQIPTAAFKVLDSLQEARNYINKKIIFPIVIKADGLAAGKGVKIAHTKQEALSIVDNIMVNKEFGSAGDRILIEDYLIGEEFSLLYITDGNTFLPLLPAKDYKKEADGDQGENTGGMGSYAPHINVTKEFKEHFEKDILDHIKSGFKKEKIDYKGVLYVGVILTNNGPMVLEFNCRFGDPETQVILPLIENDLLEIMYATACSKLHNHKIKWRNDYAACVVIASGGYPREYQKGLKIKFDLSPYEFIHAGTQFEGNDIVTNGGRVINCVALGCSKTMAIENAYKLAKKVHFEKSFYRNDIGS